jgi:hypothetical protein
MIDERDIWIICAQKVELQELIYHCIVYSYDQLVSSCRMERKSLDSDHVPRAGPKGYK